MERQLIVHFGAGALGRGLVVPILVQSGYDVVVADTNEPLNRILNEEKSYLLNMTDDDKTPVRQVPVVKALSPVTDGAKLADCLRRAQTVTTSVRRENLRHVAKTLAEAWSGQDAASRRVFCCENVEHVGSFFGGLLEEAAATPDERENLRKVAIPDTIVDRICSANWPADSGVVSERFWECAVDARVAPVTNIETIAAVDDIEAAFARKRFLMNAYADAISFFALHAGNRYLYEAARDDAINRYVAPYLALLKRLLKMKYGYAQAALDHWAAVYRQRLSNQSIPRTLDTVARNLEQKLSAEERFVFPVLELMREGEPATEGADFLANLIRVGMINQDDKKIIERLRNEWEGTPEGIRLWQAVRDRLIV